MPFPKMRISNGFTDLSPENRSRCKVRPGLDGGRRNAKEAEYTRAGLEAGAGTNRAIQTDL